MPVGKQPTIGITLGDPAGIGPEVTQAALDSGELPVGFEYRALGQAPHSTIPGQPSSEGARAALRSLEQSVVEIKNGNIDAVVTAPISKFYLQQVGFDFVGQTEFFAERAGTTDYAMLLTSGTLNVALVTIHIPLRDVAESLSVEEIVRVGNLLAKYTLRKNPSAPPQVAVPGLNPHAGEAGTIGDEEIKIIEPAVKALNSQWQGQVDFHGPLSPDTVFYGAIRGGWDGVLCMYHDQGLIPFKMHAFHSGVNTTLGLPFIRTSPDHGTAFEIAGKGIAIPGSMIAAIKLAAANI